MAHRMTDSGVTAVALYDYQAEEDDELTFEPGDIITNINYGEGWCFGELHGRRGTFHSNYVKFKLHTGKMAHKRTDSGVAAVALYHYQATKDNELTFDIWDIITNIDKMGEGWWRGELHGRRGMFPSNYVKVEDNYAHSEENEENIKTKVAEDSAKDNVEKHTRTYQYDNKEGTQLRTNESAKRSETSSADSSMGSKMRNDKTSKVKPSARDDCKATSDIESSGIPPEMTTYNDDKDRLFSQVGGAIDQLHHNSSKVQNPAMTDTKESTKTAAYRGRRSQSKDVRSTTGNSDAYRYNHRQRANSAARGRDYDGAGGGARPKQNQPSRHEAQKETVYWRDIFNFIIKHGGAINFLTIVSEFPKSMLRNDISSWFRSQTDSFRVVESEKGEISRILVYKKNLGICSKYRNKRECGDYCKYLHVCPDFILGSCTGMCPRSQAHDFTSPASRQIIKRNQLESLADEKIALLVRNSVPIVCSFYNSRGCHYHSNCAQFHICADFVKRSCTSNECAKMHNLENCKGVVKQLNLNGKPPNYIYGSLIVSSSKPPPSSRYVVTKPPMPQLTATAAATSTGAPQPPVQITFNYIMNPDPS